jgi:hypothetical protein
MNRHSRSDSGSHCAKWSHQRAGMRANARLWHQQRRREADSCWWCARPIRVAPCCWQAHRCQVAMQEAQDCHYRCHSRHCRCCCLGPSAWLLLPSSLAREIRQRRAAYAGRGQAMHQTRCPYGQGAWAACLVVLPSAALALAAVGAAVLRQAGRGAAAEGAAAARWTTRVQRRSCEERGDDSSAVRGMWLAMYVVVSSSFVCGCCPAVADGRGRRALLLLGGRPEQEHRTKQGRRQTGREGDAGERGDSSVSCCACVLLQSAVDAAECACEGAVRWRSGRCAVLSCGACCCCCGSSSVQTGGRRQAGAYKGIFRTVLHRSAQECKEKNMRYQTLKWNNESGAKRRPSQACTKRHERWLWLWLAGRRFRGCMEVPRRRQRVCLVGRCCMEPRCARCRHGAANGEGDGRGRRGDVQRQMLLLLVLLLFLLCLLGRSQLGVVQLLCIDVSSRCRGCHGGVQGRRRTRR